MEAGPRGADMLAVSKTACGPGNVEAGDVPEPSPAANQTTRRLPLSRRRERFALFEKKEAVKVLLRPGAEESPA
jgi:hypothetical protein